MSPPHRLSAKIYFAEGITVDPAKMVPLFHEWIRGRAVEGMLVDVADYKHVHQGPATVLIGHEVDYAIDLSEGRPGLTCTRKRAEAIDLQEDLRHLLRRVLLAARALQEKSDPHPPLRFTTDSLRVQVIDRLGSENSAPAASSLARELRPALARLFEGTEFKAEDAGGDRRAPLTLRVSAPGAPNLDTLLARLR